MFSGGPSLLGAIAAVCVGYVALPLLFGVPTGSHSSSSTSCFDNPSDWLHPVDLPSPLSTFPQQHNDSLLWGSYRPAVYFGLRTRSFPAALFGMMWHGRSIDQARHQCTESDVERYGWEEHDGRTYGMQRIVDTDIRRGTGCTLHTSFVKPQQLDTGNFAVSWAARVAVEHNQPTSNYPVTVFLYFGLDCDGELSSAACAEQTRGSGLTVEKTNGGAVVIKGSTKLLNQFSLQISTNEGGALSFWGGANVVLADIQDKIKSVMKGKKKPRQELPDTARPSANVVVVRISCSANCTLDAVLSSAADVPAVPFDQVTTWLSSGSKQFWDRFERTFGGSGDFNTFREADKKAAAAALSNAIGGMGYFHGKLPVEAADGGEHASFAVPLFTAVPSRPFFPRGFAWDEGFHQLLIRRWDTDIAADSLAHWMGTLHACHKVNCGGMAWLPREQTLGEEARRRVPAQFRKQSPTVANPPTLLLLADALQKASTNSEDSVDLTQLLTRLLPRMEQWLAWLLASQQVGGDDNASGRAAYQWRGRNSNDGKLNPMTLASGLDDYPRSSSVGQDERHVDLVAWLASVSGALGRISTALGDEAGGARHFKRAAELLEEIDTVHWDEREGAYFDVGLHSERGVFRNLAMIRCASKSNRNHGVDYPVPPELLQQGGSTLCPEDHPQYLWPIGDGNGGILMRPVYIEAEDKAVQFVRRVGVMNVFPLLLRLVPPDSARLPRLLDVLADRDKLWSPHGMRSLGRSDRFYQRENAPGDAPYWRGYIWMPINYLAVQALHHYAHEPATPPATAARSLEMYTELRRNLLDTVLGEYHRTGFFWEQYDYADTNLLLVVVVLFIMELVAARRYDDTSGAGRKSRPFTGWTALVVNLMGETYD